MLRQFKLILVCIAFSLFSACFVQAQVARFHHLTVDDGLTQNSITSLAQDHKGFIWIGTYAGLNKFDGYKITQYVHNPEDSASLSAGTIRCIYPDDDNNLWLATAAGGMCKLDLTTNRFTRFMVDSNSKNCIASNSVHYIAEFKKGTLYIATSGGFNLFDKQTQKFTTFQHDDKNVNSILANSTKAVCMDKRGHIWLGHWNFGLTEYTPESNTFIRYTPTDTSASRLTQNSIRALFVDSKGLIWISLWQSGINVYDPQTKKFLSSHDGTSLFKPIERVGLVSQFYEDSRSNMWFSTAEEGICKYDRATGEVTYFRNNKDDPESLGDNTVFSFLEDKNGVIWAGTWKGGLNYFDPRTLNFGYYKHESNNPNTLVNNNVYSFLDLGNNETMLGTGSNVCYFNRKEKKFSAFDIDPKNELALLPKSVVYCILKDIDGSFWYGSSGGGLYRYFPQTKKWKNYSTTADPNSVSYHTLNAMVLDNDNNLWLATTGGGINLYNREKDNFTRFRKNQNKPDSLNTDFIASMIKDKAGKIWLGSGGNGLSMLDPVKKVFTTIFKNHPDKQLADMGVSAIYVDKKGIYWLGSTDGLRSYDPASKAVKDYGKLFPELKAEFYGITEDASGNLWLSSAKGLFKFNLQSEKIRFYTKEDGIQGKEFFPGSFLKLDDGKLLIGGINGVNYFLPEGLKENSHPPQITITNFRVLNKAYPLPEEISYTKHITLSYRDYFFSLDFAAMDFSNASQNQFMYKLEGFNDDWVNIGNRHDITFTNIDPGDYVLNIKAANSSGYWNEEPLQIIISITPPFWRTTWFYLLCIVTGALLIYAYIKYREKKLRKEKEVLEQKVEERTEELNLEKIKVEEAHKDIKDSIVYAQKIQSAIIPSDDDFKKLFPDSFVLFKPKDIVSGDFYWISEVQSLKLESSKLALRQAQDDGLKFIAIADCTGHGVPGGFMTMLGNSLLNEIVNEQKIIEPADILNKLRDKIITSLKQTGKSGENKDGMDIVLLRIDNTKNELCYAAANNGFLIVSGNDVKEFDGNKQPVGIYGDVQKPFDQFKIQLQKGDIIYSFTDGYPDQFGGPKGKKFKYKQLNQILISNSSKALVGQKEILERTINDWKGNLEQVDDICVVGIRV